MGGYDGFAVCPKCKMNMNFSMTGGGSHSYRCPVCGFHVSKTRWYETSVPREQADLDGFLRSHGGGFGIVMGATEYGDILFAKSSFNDENWPFAKSVAVLETWLAPSGDLMVSVKPDTDLEKLSKQFGYNPLSFFHTHQFIKYDGEDWVLSVYAIDQDYGDESWVDKILMIDPDYVAAAKMMDEKRMFIEDKYIYERLTTLDYEVEKIKKNRWEQLKNSDEEWDDPMELKNIRHHECEAVFVGFGEPTPQVEYKEPTLEDKFMNSDYLKRKVMMIPWVESRYL